jgi:hypothetical protein
MPNFWTVQEGRGGVQRVAVLAIVTLRALFGLSENDTLIVKMMESDHTRSTRAAEKVEPPRPVWWVPFLRSGTLRISGR